MPAIINRRRVLYYPLRVGKRGIIKLNNIRFVQQDARLEKALPLFISIAENAHVARVYSDSFLKALDKIIPDEYFGSLKNRKVFYNIVEKVLSQSRYECMYVTALVWHFNLQQIPWLADVLEESAKRKYFQKANAWMMERIVFPLIRKFYTFVRGKQSYELMLVERNTWISYKQRVINDLFSKAYLVNTGREGKAISSRLLIIPKGGMEDTAKYRITAYCHNKDVYTAQVKNYVKCVMKTIDLLAKELCHTATGHLYELWTAYTSSVGKMKIYAAKVDIQDAFGNVDIGVLRNVLSELHKKSKISESDRSFIIRNIERQFVVLDDSKKGQPKLWKWTHGLLQGNRLSACLCNLYLSYMDSLYLTEFYDKPNLFVHRTTDDYLFCSTFKEDVERFFGIMKNAHKVNMEKTVFSASDIDNKEIPYCGYIFNLNTKEIRALHRFEKGTQIRHRFKLWNFECQLNTRQFLERALTFNYNNHYLSKILLNTVYNSEQTVIENYFEAMILIAFKFDAAITAIYREKACEINNNNLIQVLGAQYTTEYAKRSVGIVNAYKGTNHKGTINYSLFKQVGLKALVLVLSRRTHAYSNAVANFKTKLKSIRYKQEALPYTELIHKNQLPKQFLNIRISRATNLVSKDSKSNLI